MICTWTIILIFYLRFHPFLNYNPVYKAHVLLSQLRCYIVMLMSFVLCAITDKRLEYAQCFI